MAQVEEFVEKPDLETAKSYLASGSYAWNSGMFVWKASTILHYFEELLPDVYACLKQIGAALGTEKSRRFCMRLIRPSRRFPWITALWSAQRVF